MSFRDDLVTILSGGLPALIDGGSGATTQPVLPAGDPSRPEETAPEPQLQDSEPFLMRVTQNQILFGTAALLGVLGLVYVLKR